MKGSYHQRFKTIEERFWEKVDKSGDCWIWTAAKNSDGYGRFRVNGKCVGAHRIAYLLTFDSIPDGLQVCHACDNPACVNPIHLFLGTQRDNIVDMVAKGRQRGAPGDTNASRLYPERLARGVKNVNAKLTEEDVREIRYLHEEFGTTGADLAKQRKVCKSTICRILQRKTWGWLK